MCAVVKLASKICRIHSCVRVLGCA